MTDDHVPIGAPSAQQWRPHAGRATIGRMTSPSGRAPHELVAAALSHPASILSGFLHLGFVFMFCIQRELCVRDEHPDWPHWLAGRAILSLRTSLFFACA